MKDLIPESLTLESLPRAFAQFLTEWQDAKKVLLQGGNTNPPPTDTWFDLPGLCQYLPDKPAKPTIYAKVQGRLIPFHKKGKKLFFLKSEIDAWLKTGRRSTAIEIEAQADEYFTSKSR